MALSFLRSHYPLCRFLLRRRRLRALRGTDAPKVKEGYSIAIFPEGTRTYDGRMKRFHKGAFYLSENCNWISFRSSLRQLQDHSQGTAVQCTERHHADRDSAAYPGQRCYVRNHLSGTYQSISARMKKNMPVSAGSKAQRTIPSFTRT